MSKATLTADEHSFTIDWDKLNLDHNPTAFDVYVHIYQYDDTDETAFAEYSLEPIRGEVYGQRWINDTETSGLATVRDDEGCMYEVEAVYHTSWYAIPEED